MNNRYSFDEYMGFLEYERKTPGCRFGQNFCNYFNITDPELFYATDITKAIDIIVEKYVDIEYE